MQWLQNKNTDSMQQRRKEYKKKTEYKKLNKKNLSKNKAKIIAKS